MTDSQDTPRPAGLLRRFAAMVYDSLLLIAVGLAYGALVTLLNVLIQGAPAEREAIEWGYWRFPVFIGLIAVWVGFFYYFWGRSGQTLGMRAWRLKLTDAASGQLPAPRQRLVRGLLAPFSLFIAGLGYFWLWVDPKGHPLHGRVSGTRVWLMPKAPKA